MGGGTSKVAQFQFKIVDEKSKPTVADWIANPVKDGKRIVNKNLNLDHFKVESYIGVGRTSRVHLCKYSKNQKYYAVKYISKSWAAERNLHDNIRRELAIHSKLSHRFIANFYATFQNHSYVFLVLDYCVGSSIERFTKKAMNIGVVKFYSIQICSALTYLHKVANVAHRDLNPTNIMVSQFGHVKLIDFGSAIQLSPFQTTADTEEYLVPAQAEYCAPELLPPFKKAGTTVMVNLDQKHSFEVDWWAFGVLFFRLLTGKFPFGSVRGKRKLTRVELFGNILNGQISLPSKYLSIPGLEEFLIGLLRKNMVTRYVGTDVERSTVMKAVRSDLAHKYIPPYVPKNKLVEGDATSFLIGIEPPAPRPLTRNEFALSDYSKSVEGAMSTSANRSSAIVTARSRSTSNAAAVATAENSELHKKSSKAAIKRYSRKISSVSRPSSERRGRRPTELVPNGPAPPHA